MRRITRWLVLGMLSLGAVGCGRLSEAAIAPARARALAAEGDPNVAQVSAIVQDVLKNQWATLVGTIDRNHDGSIGKGEYAKGRSAQMVALFFGQFDANHDGQVTSSEYAAAVQQAPVVEAYRAFTEARMATLLKPLQVGDNFGFTQLRTYMTADVGLTGDWPLLTRVFKTLDLNGDQKLFSNPDEAAAFTLMFARPQLEHDLRLSVSPLP